MSADVHACGDLTEDEDGWYWANCVCGYRSGPFPDLETMVDELMFHANNPGGPR